MSTGNELIGILNNVGQNIPFNISMEAEIGYKATRIYQALLAKYVSYEQKHPEKINDGWFYSTIKDLENTTGFKYKRQHNAIRFLIDKGLIEYKVSGMPAKRHFRLIAETVKNTLINIVEIGSLAIGKLKKVKPEQISTEEKAVIEEKQDSNILTYRYDKRSLPKELDRICPLTDSADDRFARTCLDSVQRILIKHRIGKTPINTDRLIDILNDIHRSIGLKYYFDELFSNNWQDIMRKRQFTNAKAYFDTCLYNHIMSFSLTEHKKALYDTKELEKQNFKDFVTNPLDALQEQRRAEHDQAMQGRKEGLYGE